MSSSGDASPGDSHVLTTLSAVHWDVLLDRACRLHGATSAKWGALIYGGYNIVRFIELCDSAKTVIVARVPYHPVNGWNPEQSLAVSRRISSEIATMRYVEQRTTIPFPHVLEYSAEPDGDGARTPYILMTKVDGVPLSTVWDNMEDDKREIILRQVVKILLELSSHRFDKIGSIFQRNATDPDQNEWFVDRIVTRDVDDENVCRVISSAPFTSGLDYWLAYANAKLRTIDEATFGSQVKIFGYGHYWFIRSLIPTFFDPSLDEAGFPLTPGDFHSQNIMIKDIEGEPCITAIIDWEFSSTQATSSFAQYPLFIVDHPYWDKDDPRRTRNIRDRITFDTLFRQAEAHANPASGLRLSHAFSSSYGPYLLEQLLNYPATYSALYSELFDYVYAEGEGDFSVDYYRALLERGLLKKVAEKFALEAELFAEARNVLGRDMLPEPLHRREFVALVQSHIELFGEESRVKRWLVDIIA